MKLQQRAVSRCFVSTIAILAASLFVTASVALAQSQTGVRLRIDKPPAHSVRGLPAAKTRAFQTQVQRLVDAVASQRMIAQPPAPVCAALHPWIEQGVSDEGIAMATLLIGLPATRKGGVCDFGDNTAIDVWINRLKPLFTCGDPVGDETFCTLVALDPGPSGFLAHRGRKKIFHVWNQSYAPLMMPVTREQYLRARERHWAKQAHEMREQYDKLPAQSRKDDSGIRQVEAARGARRTRRAGAGGPRATGLPPESQLEDGCEDTSLVVRSAMRTGIHAWPAQRCDLSRGPVEGEHPHPGDGDDVLPHRHRGALPA
jgi:hypothetical protein